MFSAMAATLFLPSLFISAFFNRQDIPPSAPQKPGRPVIVPPIFRAFVFRETIGGEDPVGYIIGRKLVSGSAARLRPALGADRFGG
jgi:hypothetical protein